MTRSGLSKFTIPATKLTEINRKCKLINLELKAGSCVFFNYKTIHGSSSNASHKNQCRMICQMMTKNKNHKKLAKDSFSILEIQQRNKHHAIQGPPSPDGIGELVLSYR